MGKRNVSSIEKAVNCSEDGYKALALAILRVTYDDLKKGNKFGNKGNYITAKKFLETNFAKNLISYFNLEYVFEPYMQKKGVKKWQDREQDDMRLIY